MKLKLIKNLLWSNIKNINKFILKGYPKLSSISSGGGTAAAPTAPSAGAGIESASGNYNVAKKKNLDKKEMEISALG